MATPQFEMNSKNACGVDLASDVQRMKAYASLSVTLSAGLEAHKIAPSVLSALPGHITGIAVFVQAPDNGRLRMVSRAGEPEDPGAVIDAAHGRFHP